MHTTEWELCYASRLVWTHLESSMDEHRWNRGALLFRWPAPKDLRGRMALTVQVGHLSPMVETLPLSSYVVRETP